MTAQLAVFDLDGTLIDSRLDLAAAVNAMRACYHLPPLELETVTSFVGNGIRKFILRALAHHETIPIDDAIAKMKQYYNQHLTDYTTLYPGVQKGLKKLAESSWYLAVVTNKDSDSAVRILDKLGVKEFLSAIIGGTDQFPLKPAPDSLLSLCKRFTVRPGDAFMIGDHYTDLAAGKSAGMRGIFAAYGFGDPRGEPFEKRINSFCEFIDYVLPREGDRK